MGRQVKLHANKSGMSSEKNCFCYSFPYYFFASLSLHYIYIQYMPYPRITPYTDQIGNCLETYMYLSPKFGHTLDFLFKDLLLPVLMEESLLISLLFSLKLEQVSYYYVMLTLALSHCNSTQSYSA